MKKKQINTDQLIFQLKLIIKDFRLVKFSFQGKSIDKVITLLNKWQNISSLQSLFSFQFKLKGIVQCSVTLVSPKWNGWYAFDYMMDYERMGFPSSEWRVTHANNDFRLCTSYPQKLFVPLSITGKTLEMVAQYRSNGRVPVLVWKSPTKSTVICRSKLRFI
jgi:hypothetical protein